MKGYRMTAVLALLAFGAGAQTIHYNQPEDWNRGIFKDGILTYRNQWRIVSRKMTKIDPTAMYKLHLEFKGPAAPPKPLKLLGGFVVYDADKREIQPYEVIYVKGTETELSEPAAVGDTVIHLKDASKWRKNARSIAFNAKEDKKDLPNREVMVANIRDIVNNGNSFDVQLKNPLKKAYPAGTRVRQHIYSSFMYVIHDSVSGDWKEKDGSVSGISDGRSPYHNGKWWPGAAYFMPFISVSPRNDGTVEVKNIRVDVKTQNDIF